MKKQAKEHSRRTLWLECTTNRKAFGRVHLSDNSAEQSPNGNSAPAACTRCCSQPAEISQLPLMDNATEPASCVSSAVKVHLQKNKLTAEPPPPGCRSWPTPCRGHLSNLVVGFHGRWILCLTHCLLVADVIVHTFFDVCEQLSTEAPKCHGEKNITSAH